MDSDAYVVDFYWCFKYKVCKRPETDEEMQAFCEEMISDMRSALDFCRK